ncbi:hypothetical protein JW933_11385 [candidate division FCPU426 bacterium]|nr:hypothetical protein [candidate division FCPU426 bacterium]
MAADISPATIARFWGLYERLNQGEIKGAPCRQQAGQATSRHEKKVDKREAGRT